MSRLALRVPPPIVALLTATLMWLLTLSLPQLTTQSPYTTPAAITLALLGFLIDVTGLIQFRKHKTTFNPLKPERATALVTTGIYQITRNPMYLGMVVVLTGWAVYLANPIVILGLPVFVLYITKFQIQPEEAILEKLFGDDFRNYQASVRRWL